MNLTPRQLHVVERAKQTRTLALFWPCGAGKSIAALSVALQGWKAGRVLVLARKDNLLTWKHEASLLGHDLTPIHAGYKFVTCPQGSVVISHDLAARHWKSLPLQGYDALIVDESYAVKNPHSNRSKATYEIARRIPKRVILNALPFADQGYVDIFGQYKVLDCGQTYGTALTRFRENYQNPHPAGFGWEDDPHMLKPLIRKATKNADIMDEADVDLPQAVDKRYLVEWHPIQREIYETLRDKWRATFQGVEIDTLYAVAKLAKLHQICGGHFRTADTLVPVPNRKADVLDGIVDNLNGKRCVIWCAYNSEVESLSRRYKGAAFTGRTGTSILSTKWTTLVAQMRCGVGLNELTNVEYVIYYSKYWSWYHYMQSRGRTRRISSRQKRTFYFSLEIEGSVDSLVERNLTNKNESASEFAALGKELLYGK